MRKFELATPEEKPTLEQLMQLHLHDFSEFAEPDTSYGETGQNGTYRLARRPHV